MNNSTTWVGMDVHKDKIFVSLLSPGEEGSTDWNFSNKPGDVKKFIKRLKKRAAPSDTVACYEAGPCGYGLARTLQEAGIRCIVAAPSLIPVKPGERIKTDKRDAQKLARVVRSGDVTEVPPPSPEAEAARDLVRGRADARNALKRARQQLSHFLLRREIRYTAGKRAWTRMYTRWLQDLSFERKVDQMTVAQYLLAIEQGDERLAALDAEIEALSQTDAYREMVGALRCFRGIDTLSAMTFITELYDFARFCSARDLMGFVGLVPSEHSSGNKRRQGSITKAGNGEVRRILVQAAKHCSSRPRVSADLSKRRAGQPAAAIARADKAQQRLYKRHRHLSHRGKHANVVTVAIARELTGFLWDAIFQIAVAKQMQQQQVS